MKANAKEIKDYWGRQSPNYQWDAETLDFVVDTLSDAEREVLNMGYDVCKKCGDTTWETYILTVSKAFNRHNDLLCRYTTADENGNLTTSLNSSITELDINVRTLTNCNRAYIYHINDFSKSLLPKLPLETIADLTTALVKYNATHDIKVGQKC